MVLGVIAHIERKAIAPSIHGRCLLPWEEHVVFRQPASGERMGPKGHQGGGEQIGQGHTTSRRQQQQVGNQNQ